MDTAFVLSQKQISDFQLLIFSWWEKNKRDLPWRHTHDPYKILVSELMLQQTQVSRVLPKYQEFLELFPTVHSLAQASVGDVLRAWKGMGYNRRALYLRKLAEKIVQEYKGVFPQQEKELLELPGLGIYTTRAIMVFAFQLDVAMVDTNVRQIIVHHFFNGEKQKEKIIQEVADKLVPSGKSWAWHQALMDYGSIEMKKINPRVVIARSHRRSNPFKVKEDSPSYLPFHQTKRFSRGRIMDLLREKDYKEQELLQEMKTKYGKEPEYIQEIIIDLQKDGLLTRSKNAIISLPH